MLLFRAGFFISVIQRRKIRVKFISMKKPVIGAYLIDV